MARALYIHWPYCLSKCPYCDFNSHVRTAVDHGAFEAALIADLRHEASVAPGEALHSVFFGGGTPSLMPPALVQALLAEAERLWGFAPGIEITLEANPSSVEAGRFADLAAAGVNRVSLGIQALDDEVLRFLGRLHSADEGRAALGIAQRCFARINADFIYARPGQGAEAWRRELEQAIGLGTEHLSLYQLTIEPGTRFASDVRRRAFLPLADDPAADLFALTREWTAAAGIPAYEVSNHARPGAESRHNLTYWRYGDYLGIGPGAHGRRGGRSTMRHRKPENYLAAVAEHGHGIVGEEPLSRETQAAEALLMGLRLAEGIDLGALSARFDLAADALVDGGKLSLYCSLGLIDREAGRVTVTEAGMPLLDRLLGEIVATTLVAA